MSADRWRVALDGYLVPVGGGREREVYDEGDEVVLAADYERDVAAAEVRGFNDGIGEGWNAALEALPHDRACIVNGRAGAKCNCVRGRAIAALRRPEPGRCICDGGAYEVKAHPFIVNDACAIHGRPEPAGGEG